MGLEGVAFAEYASKDVLKAMLRICDLLEEKEENGEGGQDVSDSEDDGDEEEAGETPVESTEVNEERRTYLWGLVSQTLTREQTQTLESYFKVFCRLVSHAAPEALLVMTTEPGPSDEKTVQVLREFVAHAVAQTQVAGKGKTKSKKGTGGKGKARANSKAVEEEDEEVFTLNYDPDRRQWVQVGTWRPVRGTVPATPDRKLERKLLLSEARETCPEEC